MTAVGSYVEYVGGLWPTRTGHVAEVVEVLNDSMLVQFQDGDQYVVWPDDVAVLQVLTDTEVIKVSDGGEVLPVERALTWLASPPDGDPRRMYGFRMGHPHGEIVSIHTPADLDQERLQAVWFSPHVTVPIGRA